MMKNKETGRSTPACCSLVLTVSIWLPAVPPNSTRAIRPLRLAPPPSLPTLLFLRFFLDSGAGFRRSSRWPSVLLGEAGQDWRGP